jgi:hypothetical protein
MKYAVEMGSGAMICIPSFIKIGSGIQKFMGGDTQTHRRDGYRISLLQESRLKTIGTALFSCPFCEWLSTDYTAFYPRRQYSSQPVWFVICKHYLQTHFPS